jgi:DNA invertase Pin-like site-specific DNA recombinase
MALNFAEIERKFIGKRTKDAMAKPKETKHVRRPRALPAATIAQVLQLWDTGLAMKAAAERLNADGVPSASGQPDWSVAKVQTAPKSLTAQGQYKG